eukprot:6461578-Amphidinium_carterae.1
MLASAKKGDKRVPYVPPPSAMLASMQLPASSTGQSCSSTDVYQPPAVSAGTAPQPATPVPACAGAPPVVPHEEILDYMPTAEEPPAAEGEAILRDAPV